MTTARDRLGRHFPGVNFADDDPFYVEVGALPVGPAGSELRSDVEAVWPGAQFSDTSVLVAKTDVVRAADEVVVPGSVQSDSFDGPAGPVDDRIWTVASGSPALDGDGHAIFSTDAVATHRMTLVYAGELAGRAVIAEWEQIGDSSQSARYPELYVERQGDSTYWVQMRAAAGHLEIREYHHWAQLRAYPVRDDAQMRFWKIEASPEGVIVCSTSPDGETWTEQLRQDAPQAWTQQPCTYRLGSVTGATNAYGSVPDLCSSFRVAP